MHNRGAGLPGPLVDDGSRVFTDPASQTITLRRHVGYRAGSVRRQRQRSAAYDDPGAVRRPGRTGQGSTGDVGTPAIDGIDEAINSWLGVDGLAKVEDGRLVVTVKTPA